MQPSLFGEPELKPGLSQWHTPPWLARRLAGWVARGARVLEPSCGGGNLLQALLRAGHSPTNLTGMEIDPEWVASCRERAPGVTVLCGDFLSTNTLAMVTDPEPYDVVLMNPPFEGNGHLRFVLRALEIAPVVVGIFPASFEFSKERDAQLWSKAGIVSRRARMPQRVDFGGEQSGMSDTVALWIDRRPHARPRNEVAPVLEEVWLP